MNRSLRAFLWTGLLLAGSATLFAQGWALPAKTPGTTVACTSCPNAPANALTVGYSAPITTFTGRFLDSSNTSEWFLPFRTARAKFVLVKPELDRIYFRYGDGTVASYQLSRFFTRLEAGEPMVMPVQPTPPFRGSSPEVFLKWDEYWNPELGGSGWKTFNIDGSLRMTWFDVDDKGYVYIASTLYGWGIVQDQLTNIGQMMKNVVQKQDIQPSMIAVVKGASKYYAILGTKTMFDVTDRAHPVPAAGNNVPGLKAFAKNTAGDRIALVDSNYGLTINSGDGFATGTTPMLSDLSTGFKSITSDGTNFFALTATNKIAVIVASASGYTIQNTYPVDATMLADAIHYGDGYLVLSGADSGGAWDMRVMKVGSNLVPTAVPTPAYPAITSFPSYFRSYYGSAPSGYVTPGYVNMYDGTVYKAPNGNSYLVVCAKGIGDVYQIAAGDAITVSNDGRAGHTNLNAPPASNTHTYYGDPVQVTAKSSSQNVQSVTWNFGNPEAAQANTQISSPNVPVIYQYSNLSRTTLGPKTVSASAGADIKGQTVVTLEMPSARFGIAGTKYLFAQPNASSTAPVIVGDFFNDQSDGSIESHYASWTIDGVTTKLLPTELMPVGDCGTHTAQFVGFYGPYTGTGPSLATSGAPFPVGLSGAAGSVTYGVAPFAAAVDLVGTDVAGNLIFRSSSRINQTLANAAQGFTYKWELVTSAGAVLLAGPTGAGPVVPDWPLAKQSLAGAPQGARVRLTLTANAPAAFPGACAGYASTVAYSNPLNAPDPQIVPPATCDATPCTFTVTSASGIDTVADKWTYKWSVTPAGAIDPSTVLTNSTMTTSFFNVGTFTVQVLATNSIGSQTASTSITVNVKTAPCAKMDNSSFTAGFTGSSGCGPGIACAVGETVVLSAVSPLIGQHPYDPNCAPHTYAWSFNGASIGNGNNLSYTVATSGTFSVTVSNGSDSHSYSVALTVASTGGGGGGGNGGGGGGGGTGGGNPCGTMSATNIQPTWNGPGCPSGGTAACTTSAAISFSVQPYLYDFNCANHTFQWKWDDGSTTNGQNVSHAFTKDGTHQVSVTVSNIYNAVGVTKTFQVNTAAGSGNTGGGSCPTMTTSNIAISYSAASGCSSNNTNSPCQNGEAVNFDVTSFTGYDFSCSNHTFVWDFGDGATANTKQASHAFSSTGTHNVKVTISNSSQSGFVRALSMSTSAGSGGGNSGNCGPITPNVTLSINYGNSSGTCSPLGGQCAAGEVVNFTVVPYQYDLGCATHTYDWDFGDGSPHGTTKDVSHQYQAAGNYTAHCAVSNGGTPVTLTQAVRVQPSGNPGSITVKPTFVVAPLQGVSNGYLFTPSFDHPELVTAWSWDYGDGQSSGRITGSATSPTPTTHVYADNKKYMVTLTAFNGSSSVGTVNLPNETGSGKSHAVRKH